ncbi:hypothetical protein ScPMuIL_013050 [Solemya velum]
MIAFRIHVFRSGAFPSNANAVDWWSLGVLTYELLTGASPFTVDGEKNTQTEISRRILRATPPMPKHFSRDVRDFIQKLLCKLPRKRLGSHGAWEIKKHNFFQGNICGLNWEELAKKALPAPFMPKIGHELDVSNFAEEFTTMAAADSPAIVPMDSKNIFKGYSYVAPSVLFGENTLSNDFMARTREHQPEERHIFCASFRNSTFFQHYELDLKERPLGDGSFSICRKCRQRKNGVYYAVKIVSRRIDCTREIQSLRMCQGHRNIVTLVDVFYDELHTYIVLELLRGGELLERIRKKKNFTEPEASEIMWKLVQAVDYMHSHGVVHRDLKPENLIFENESEGAEIKIVDFGFARLNTENQKLRTPCFTLPYAAPEVLRQAMTNKDGYDELCDLWSLGVILYTMLSGKVPFQSTSHVDLAAAIMQKIKGGQFDLSGPEWKDVSDNAKKLIKGLLAVEPKKRLTMSELLHNDWLRGHNTRVFSQAPLQTPGILSATSSALHLQLSVTMDAFHQAKREGFLLQDVNKAPLAKRRKLKKSSLDGRSGSSDSTNSTGSGGSSGTMSSMTQSQPLSQSPTIESPTRNLSNVSNFSNSSNNSVSSNVSQASLCSTGFTPNLIPESASKVKNTMQKNSNETAQLSFLFSSSVTQQPQMGSTTLDCVPEPQLLCSDSSNKRKRENDSIDDCFIIEENSSNLNNNKRQRTGTIVIDD